MVDWYDIDSSLPKPIRRSTPDADEPIVDWPLSKWGDPAAKRVSHPSLKPDRARRKTRNRAKPLKQLGNAREKPSDKKKRTWTVDGVASVGFEIVSWVLSIWGFGVWDMARPNYRGIGLDAFFGVERRQHWDFGAVEQASLLLVGGLVCAILAAALQERRFRRRARWSLVLIGLMSAAGTVASRVMLP